MGYDKTYVFTRLGKIVKKYNAVADHPDGVAGSLDSLLEEAVEVFNSSDEDRWILNLLSSANRSDQSACESMKRQAVSVATGFLTHDVRARLGVVGSSAAAVLDALRDAMQDEADTVLETAGAMAGPFYDNDNTGNGEAHLFTFDQAVREANHFECECVNADTAGSERWRVSCSRLGYLGEAETGVQFDSFMDNDDGITPAGVRFTIEQASGTAAEDWAVGDKVRFSTYVMPLYTETGDGSSQMQNYLFAGLSFGENTDDDKKIYLDLEEAAGSPAVYRVSVYKDSSRTELIAQGESENATATVELEEKNSSGLSGQVDVDYSTDDSDVVIEFGSRPRFQHFLVENFGAAMPAASSGSNTVDDDLAN